MGASDSDMGVRQRLLDLIDGSGVPDRRLSMLATGTADTVRNMRRGATPQVNSIQALLQCLGFKLQIVPLEEPEQVDARVAGVRKRHLRRRRRRPPPRRQGSRIAD